MRFFLGDKRPLLGVLFCVLFPVSTWAQVPIFTFSDVLQNILRHDQQLENYRTQYKTLRQQRAAVGKLPDTQFALTASNFPVSSLVVDQDPMSAWKISVTQGFNRIGKTDLQREHLSIAAKSVPMFAENLQKQFMWSLAERWSDAYFGYLQKKVIQQAMAELKPMVAAVSSSYSNGQTAVSQQDIISAELSLLELEAQLLQQSQNVEMLEAEITAWGMDLGDLREMDGGVRFSFQQVESAAANALIQDSFLQQLDALTLPKSDPISTIYELLASHPMFTAMALQEQQAASDIAIVTNKKQPKFGVSASYGIRGHDSSERNVDDLLSVGVTVSVPLFGNTEIAAEHKAAVLKKESLKTQRYLAIQQRLKRTALVLSAVKHTEQRIVFLQQSFIPQRQQQSEAALTAYSNQKQDLSSVLQAKLQTLNTQLALFQLLNQRLKYKAELVYLLNVDLGANSHNKVAYYDTQGESNE